MVQQHHHQVAQPMVLHQVLMVSQVKKVEIQVTGHKQVHRLIQMVEHNGKVMVELVERQEEQSQDQIIRSKAHSTQQQSKDSLTHDKLKL
jgi:Na+/phosphate symporter